LTRGSFERAREAGVAHPSGEHDCPYALPAEIFSQAAAITAHT
jgi:hypothetical protein